MRESARWCAAFAERQADASLTSIRSERAQMREF